MATQERPASRRVAWLDSQIVRCNHRVQRAAWRAERAGLLARQGHLEAAGREIADLHEEFDRQPLPEVSVGLYLAEAWMAYFSNLSPDARAKVQRAHVLSEAAGLTQQRALSSAWLAHFDYVRLEVEAMANHVHEALALAAPEAHATRSRACLVLANAYHLAGRMDLAQPWYTRSRQHAVAEDDPMTLSALIHNMAWHQALQSVQAALWGEPGVATSLARRAVTSAGSTHHFDLYRDVVSLPALIQVAIAMAQSVLGEPAEALALYEAHAPQADAQGLRPLRALVLADMAWCCHQVGHVAKATHYAEAAETALVFSQHADDKALAHGRLALVFRVLKRSRLGKRHEAQSGVHQRAHQDLQHRLLSALDGLVPHVR